MSRACHDLPLSAHARFSGSVSEQDEHATPLNEAQLFEHVALIADGQPSKVAEPGE
jgi:hypothetical protein